MGLNNVLVSILDNSIKFTVSGDYIPILSFVSAIENDSKLGFRIENFKLIPGGNNLQATFETRNINIKTEGVNTAVQSTIITESAPTNTPDTNTQNTNSTTETTQP